MNICMGYEAQACRGPWIDAAQRVVKKLGPPAVHRIRFLSCPPVHHLRPSARQRTADPSTPLAAMSPSVARALRPPPAGGRERSASMQGANRRRLRPAMSRVADSGDEESGAEGVSELSIPTDWCDAAKASQESAWLRASLREWLDNEYCPEDANVEISERCSRVLYRCLLEGQVELGDVLMQMVRDLEGFSFRHSFHGAFSASNAAIDLITKRILAHEESAPEARPSP